MRELRQLLTGSATAWRRGVAAFFQRNTGITRAGLPDLIDTLEEFAAEHGRPTPPPAQTDRGRAAGGRIAAAGAGQ